jgi:hypothetical protein
MNITISRNTPAALVGLSQFETYRGLIGCPTERINKQILQELQFQARELFNIRDIWIILPQMDFLLSKPLPRYSCMGLLRHGTPIKMKYSYSSVIFIWFQDKYALPIDEQVLLDLKTIPWEMVAGDYDL